MTTTDTTAALDLDAIRELVNRATLGPWTLVERQDGDRRILVVIAEGQGDEHDDALVAEVPMSPGDDESGWRGDAEFIAASRTLLPALAAEVDRHRARIDAAPAAGVDISLATWCSRVADAHRYYEEQHPGDDRDRGLVEWVVRALGNPEQEGARDVLAVLAARHHDELAPNGTAAWFRQRVAELTAEMEKARAELAAAKAADAHCDHGYPVGGAHPRIDWCGLRKGHTGPHHGGERIFFPGGTVQRSTAVPR